MSDDGRPEPRTARLLRRLTGRLGPLRSRDLRLVFSATLASSLGSGAAGVALAFAVVGPLSDELGTEAALIWCYIAALLVTLAALLVPDIRNLDNKPADG